MVAKLEQLYDSFNAEVIKNIQLENEIKKLKSNFGKAIDEAYDYGKANHEKWQAIAKIKEEYLPQ